MKIIDTDKLVSLPVWQMILVFGLVFGFTIGLGFGLHWLFSLNFGLGAVGSVLAFSLFAWMSEDTPK